MGIVRGLVGFARKYGGYVVVCSLTSLFFLHCASVGSVDSGIIDAEMVDAPPVPPSVPSRVYSSAGGGFTASGNYRARVSIGAPSPMGRTNSANYNVQSGPTVR